MSSLWGVGCGGVRLHTEEDLKRQENQDIFLTHLYSISVSYFCINIKSLNLGGMGYKHVREKHQEKEAVCWGEADPWAVSHSLALLVLFAHGHDVTLKESPGFH